MKLLSSIYNCIGPCLPKFFGSSSQLQHDKFELMKLPADMQMEIAKRLDRTARAKLRLTCKDLKVAGNEAVKHIKVNNREDLRGAIET